MLIGRYMCPCLNEQVCKSIVKAFPNGLCGPEKQYPRLLGTINSFGLKGSMSCVHANGIALRLTC